MVWIKIIKKRIEDNLRRWHEKFSEVVWVHRTSRHRATKIGLQNLRVTESDSLSAKEYNELMMDKIDDVPESRFKALEEIEREKVKRAKAYKKRITEKSFQVGDLVWKMILPLGTQSGKYGMWSPSWEGPFTVIRVVPGNA
jgi:hypothetical protein